MKLSILALVISLFFITFTHSSTSAQTEPFSKAECISQLTSKDIIPPYRLSVAKATLRCDAIQKRVDLLSKQILGKWQLIGSGRRNEILEFSADGSVETSFYNSDLRRRDTRVESWAIVNPYGTVGSEVIQFNDDFLREIKISSTTMTIISTPTSAINSYSDRYKRIK